MVGHKDPRHALVILAFYFISALKASKTSVESVKDETGSRRAAKISGIPLMQAEVATMCAVKRANKKLENMKVSDLNLTSALELLVETFSIGPWLERETESIKILWNIFNENSISRLGNLQFSSTIWHFTLQGRAKFRVLSGEKRGKSHKGNKKYVVQQSVRRKP